MKPVRLAVTASVAVALGGCLPPPSPGDGGPDKPSPEERLRQRVAALEDQLARLKEAREQDASASSGVRQGLEALTVEVEDLREEVRGQQGTLEVVQHRVERLTDRQRRLYEDMDARLRALESGEGGASGSSGSQEASAGSDGGGASELAGDSPKEAYDAAFARIEASEYEAAASAFQAFLKEYPDSDLAPNARYWLGEAHYVLRDFEQALVEFNKVLQGFPDSQKAPAALLKIGYSFYELGEMGNARKALERVRERFPDSSEARLARKRLNRMDEAE